MNMNSKNKKGVEMSLNVIIIAAIGLLILLILAFLVVQSGGKVTKGLDSCSTKYAGICTNKCDNADNRITATTDCSANTNGNTICCKIV